MSLFGFGTPTELTTHIGVMVKSATDSLRIGPDWTLNVQICDEINRNRREFSEQAIRAIKRRLGDNDQQTVYLALILLETCMKNCGTEFAGVVDRSVMDDMVRVASGVQGAKGMKNSEEALRLISTWARVFEHRRSSFPLFFDTFMHMKARGITFPKEDDKALLSYEGFERSGSRRGSRETPSSAAGSVAVDFVAGMEAPSSVGANGAPFSGSATGAVQVEDEFLKLQLDLSVVMEKVNLCREILQVSSGIQHDEALADIIGFLEACRDRMGDVIEAGTHGLLGEELFEVALKVNDAVLRTLDAERTGTKIAVGEEDEAVKKETSTNLLDLSPVNTPKTEPSAAVSAQFTDDLFAPAPTPASAAVDFDPFGNNAPASTSTATMPTVIPARNPSLAVPPVPSHNPFNSLAPAPGTATSQPPLAPIGDDFALLVGASPAKTMAPPPAGGAPLTNGAFSVAQDFDDFLASLEKKN